MSFRCGRVAFVFVPIIAAALWTWAGQAAPAPEAPKSLPAPESPTARLFKPRPFSGIDDPDTSLGDALSFLGAKYDVTFDVNDEAFRAEQLDNVRKNAIGTLPKMANASLDRVLRKLLGRLPVEAVYMVRPDHIEITTGKARMVEVWGRYNGPYLPLVHANFENRPLAEALQELSRQAGVSIVVDARAAENYRKAYTGMMLRDHLGLSRPAIGEYQAMVQQAKATAS